ncbi:hypothetical protein [Streptomyces lasiicapitis]|uniref:hypothetical protein n=1 Tax=Streptomyces lasiicapitis TaxID=1923961 RepID=UPI0036A16853
MRVIAGLLAAVLLILAGLWPPLAVVPIGLAVTGAAVVTAQIPGWLLLAGGGYLALRGRAA